MCGVSDGLKNSNVAIRAVGLFSRLLRQNVGQACSTALGWGRRDAPPARDRKRGREIDRQTDREREGLMPVMSGCREECEQRESSTARGSL